MANTDQSEWRLIGTSLSASSTDMILPVISSHFYYVINEAGSGEVSIPLDSVSAGIVTEGMLAVLYYRGAIRASFLIENIRKVPASSQEEAGQVLSLSGRGGMTVLDRAIVWGDGTTSTTRTFTSVTKASILVTLVTEAQARGGLSTLTLDFDATNDSDSVAWTDSETYNLNVGTTLLDVLRQFAKTGIDFEMNYSGTGFVLSAYKNGIGTDKSETIFFRTGTNCQEIDIDQRGNDIKNALLVAYKEGAISLTDSASITANGRREELLDARLAQTASSATTYGAAVLSTKKDTKIGRTIKVYDGLSPYLFVNYILGDTVTLDIEGTETGDRILGIQCDFDGSEYSNVVIELNSLMLEQNLKMQQDIDYLLTNWQTAHDANLLAVSYWAAIGDANIAITSTADMIKIGSKLYTLSTSAGGWLLSYDTTTGAWNVLIGVGGINTPLTMTAIGTDIYIGGFHAVYKYATATATLTNIGAVVYTDPNTEAVWAIGASGTDIYVSGVFDSIDGVAASDLAKYDTLTDTWTAGFGSGVTGIAQVILAVGSDIYMGGSFTAVDGVPASKVAKWNGSVWAALDAGLDFTVYSLVEYGTSILAGGGFTGGISEWNGSAWTVFGGGISSGFVYKIAVYLTDVYIVGTFTDLGNRIARYSGGSWWTLDTGLNNTVLDMVLFDNDVYVGGTFTTAGDKPAVGVAAYFSNFEALVDYLENSSSSFNMGAAIHAATASAITDSDEVPFWEDVANALRKITWANIKATLKTYFDTLYVALTGNQTIAGVKTFSSDPIIPDEAYDATAWNGSLEPPTKNAVRDKIETVGLPAGSNLQVQINNSGVFGADDEFEYTLGGQIISLGRDAGAEASAVWSWQTGGVSFHNLASWGTGNYSSMRGILARGTKASPTAAQADDIGMRFRGSAYDGVGLVLSSATGAEIRFVANENQSATNHGMRAEIWTTPNGSTTETKTLVIGAGGIASNVTANKTLTLTATDNFTLTIPGSGTAALLAAENVFTAGNTFNGGAIFNEDGLSTSNFRVESDTEANMIFLTASTDLLRFGGNTDATSLSVLKGGYTGIGGEATSNAALLTQLTATSTTAVGKWGLSSIVYGNPASSSAELYYGGEFGARSTAANAQNFTGQFLGGVFRAIHQGTGTMNTAIGGQFRTRTSSTGVITNAYSLYILSANNTNSSTITNQYGLFIADINEGVTLNYAIYTGAGLVRFGDAVSSTGSILSSNATTGIGYTTGAGGTVTQATNKATGVTLNKTTGLITMNNAALAAGTTVTFTLTNSAIAATDTIILNHASAGTAGAYTLNAQVAAGSATINVRNVTAGSLSEAIVIRYTVIKSVSA